MTVQSSDTARPSLPIGLQHPWLAPLAGFTDLPFRVLCRELGAGAACTEMISAKGLLFNNASTWRLLASCQADQPLVVQLYGSEPDMLARAVRELRLHGLRWFDLNAGCPVKKVVRTGAGAAMLGRPDRLAEAAAAMIEAGGPGRVGLKIRPGWDDHEPAYLRIAERLTESGLGWISMHPRSVRQGFKGRADWEKLGQLQQAVPFPVLGSGDIFSEQDARRCLAVTGIAGVMFARGALQDPLVFSRLSRTQAAPGLESSGEQEGAGVRQRLMVVRRHIQLCQSLAPDRSGFLKMRLVIPKYLRAFQGVREVRRRVLRCRTWPELTDCIDDIEKATLANDGSAWAV